MKLNIGNIICSMYTTVPESIKTNFVLTHKRDIIAKGKATIKEKSESIILNGNLEDINIDKFKSNNIIFVSIDDLPLYYSCELKEFPIENRKNNIKNKEIIINFPKVKIGNNFSFNMPQNNSKFECEMTPLCAMNEDSPLLCNIYVNEV